MKSNADEIIRPLKMKCVKCGGNMTVYPTKSPEGIGYCPHCSPSWLKSFAVFYERAKKKNGTGGILTAIKQARIDAGLSQAKLAKLCGWDGGRQSRLESGLENPTVKTLERIAKAINKQLYINFVERVKK